MICQLLLSCTGTLCLNDFGSVSVLREDQTIQTQLSYRESHYQSDGPLQCNGHASDDWILASGPPFLVE